MNVDVNKYLMKIILLDSDMKAYRQSSEDDIQRYRKRNEEKLAALKSQLKDAEEKSVSIKQERLAEAKKLIEQGDRELEENLNSSQIDFDKNKEQIVEDIFNELFT